jgi:hypothetical protein
MIKGGLLSASFVACKSERPLSISAGKAWNPGPWGEAASEICGLGFNERIADAE